VPAWDRKYGGLGVGKEVALAIDRALAPYRLHRLNPLGLHNAATALFAHGTEAQRRRFLPPMVRNEERWCQLFRARKNRGITYFLLDLHQPGVEIRPLVQITGESEFNEVWLDGARIPDDQRVGPVDGGWKVGASTLSSERQMVAGSGSGGGIGRLGGIGADKAIALAADRGRWADPVLRQTLVALWAEERTRGWTNQRVHATVAAGGTPGPAASIGKVHQATLNQRIQAAVADLLGADALAWDDTADNTGATGAPPSGAAAYGATLRPEVQRMLRSRANSIEDGTTEVNKNILGERVLGLPREPDPWHRRPWSEVPRS